MRPNSSFIDDYSNLHLTKFIGSPVTFKVMRDRCIKHFIVEDLRNCVFNKQERDIAMPLVSRNFCGEHVPNSLITWTLHIFTSGSHNDWLYLPLSMQHQLFPASHDGCRIYSLSHFSNFFIAFFTMLSIVGHIPQGGCPCILVCCACCCIGLRAIQSRVTDHDRLEGCSVDTKRTLSLTVIKNKSYEMNKTSSP